VGPTRRAFISYQNGEEKRREEGPDKMKTQEKWSDDDRQRSW